VLRLVLLPRGFGHHPTVDSERDSIDPIAGFLFEGGLVEGLCTMLSKSRCTLARHDRGMPVPDWLLARLEAELRAAIELATPESEEAKKALDLIRASSLTPSTGGFGTIGEALAAVPALEDEVVRTLGRRPTVTMSDAACRIVGTQVLTFYRTLLVFANVYPMGDDTIVSIGRVVGFLFDVQVSTERKLAEARRGL
jgi:hypothetical protein